MAANDYYQTLDPGRRPTQPDREFYTPSPTSSHAPRRDSLPLNSQYQAYQPGSSSYAPSPHNASFDTQNDTLRPSRDSYSHAVYGASASHDDRQYADNIPLKSTTSRRDSQMDPFAQSTQYPPSPESQHPNKSRRRPKKQGWFTGKITWVVFIVTVVQIGVFIGEIVANSTKTGSPIMIKPTVNPMLGPSPYVLINMGARFVPCMRPTKGTNASESLPCPESTSADPEAPVNQCKLPQLCGFGAPLNEQPVKWQHKQWYRFILPIFLHGGLIHIAFNLLLQLTLGREMELTIGSLRFALVYFSSGIFGFVLGGNFAPPGIASTGASGCLFGILALVLLDLFYTWSERPKPVRELILILVEFAIAFVLGLLPGLDNFSHIGGFLMGLVLGICILHSPNALRQRIGVPSPTYEAMEGRTASGTAAPTSFAKGPIGFFKGRKPAWWAWWLLRAGALLGVLVSFVVLLNNFYVYENTCSWCKYLSCLDVSNWCDYGKIQPAPQEKTPALFKRGFSKIDGI